MLNIFSYYRTLSKTFAFQKNIEVFCLIIGGVLLSLLELVGISAVFPLMMLILNPELAIKGAVISKLYEGLGFASVNNFAIFLSLIVIFAFLTKVIFHILFFRYEFHLLNKWRIKITSEIFHRLMYASYEKVLRKSSGEIINIVTASVPNIVNNYLHQCINLIQISLLSCLLFFYMLYLSPILFTFVAITSFAIIGFFYYFQRNRLRLLGKNLQEYSRGIFEILQQSIAGLKETKIHQKENFFSKKFKDMSEKTTKVDLEILFANNLPNIVVEFIVIIIIFLSFTLMIFISDDLASSAAKIVVLVILGLRIVPLMNRSISSFAMINSSKEQIARTLELYKLIAPDNVQVSKLISAKNTPKLDFNHAIRLKDLSYHYGNIEEFSINKINLTIKKNEYVGIVGPSGSGKTTMVNILLGFLEDYQGEYLIDDTKIKDEKIYSVRKITSHVDQQPFIYNGNILKNVAYGEEEHKIDEGRVLACIKNVGLYDYVKKAKDGLRTELGENGKLLSGGQRQRLVLARALYRKTKILILDEASSALDMESENLLIEFLETMRGKMTIIAIAHRLSTLKHCDRILFMENGEIIDEGSFAKLYKGNKKFKAYVDTSNIEIK